MTKDLIEIKEALEYFSNLYNYTAPLQYGELDYKHTPIHNHGLDKAKEALSLLNKHIERLESEDLVDAVTVALINDYDVNNDDYTYRNAAKAAIETIKGR